MNLKQPITILDIPNIDPLISTGGKVGNDLVIYNNIERLPRMEKPVLVKGTLIGFVRRGTASYVTGGVERHLSAGDIFIIADGQTICDNVMSDDANCIGIHGSIDFFQEIIKDMHEMSSLFIFSRQVQVIHTTQEESSSFLRYFYQIEQKMRDLKHPYRLSVCACILKAMIYDLGYIIWTNEFEGKEYQSRSRAEELLTSFVKLVEKYFHSERKVNWYAKQLNISPKYLSEIVKQRSKKTPNDWIDEYVVMEMKSQLRNTTKSIGEISYEMSFPNQSFFGKYFKEHTGVSPSAYRSGNVKNK